MILQGGILSFSVTVVSRQWVKETRPYTKADLLICDILQAPTLRATAAIQLLRSLMGTSLASSCLPAGSSWPHFLILPRWPALWALTAPCWPSFLQRSRVTATAEAHARWHSSEAHRDAVADVTCAVIIGMSHWSCTCLCYSWAWLWGWSSDVQIQYLPLVASLRTN